MRQDPSNMHGIVLCAGLGTRLRPLTTVVPKPAIPIGDLPAALRNAEQMFDMGFSLVHCNTHYLAPELERELRAACLSRSWPLEKVRFWHETQLLETGGGIARIVQCVTTELGHDKPWDTFVVSGDIVADIPLSRMLSSWRSRAPDVACLMVTLPLDKPRKDVTWVDLTAQEVVGFGADLPEETAQINGYSARVFSNHQIISGELLAAAPVIKQSSIDLFYRSALQRGKRIRHCDFGLNNSWFDVGTPENYIACLRKLDLRDDQAMAWSNQVLLVYAQDKASTPPDPSRIMLNQQDLADQSLTKHEQASTAVLQNPDWQWLGRLHTWPDALTSNFADLVSIVDSLQAGSSDSSSRPLGASLGRRYLFDLLSGSLLHPFKTLAASPRRGFLTVTAPDQRLSLPLLVPLPLLLGETQTDSMTASPFWLLVIPQKR
jgi:mannose-1-phosphate guanylyltransferase